MEAKSPSARIKQTETQISRLLRPVEPHKLPSKVRNILAKLQQDLVDARIYSRDYELSETREEQLENGQKAKNYLEKVGKSVAAASEYDIFGAADVAHLTAEIEQAKDDLK